MTTMVRHTENQNVTMRGLTPETSHTYQKGLNGNIGYKLTDNMGYTLYSTFHRL